MKNAIFWYFWKKIFLIITSEQILSIYEIFLQNWKKYLIVLIMQIW
jgi:hypothetical protein